MSSTSYYLRGRGTIEDDRPKYRHLPLNKDILRELSLNVAPALLHITVFRLGSVGPAPSHGQRAQDHANTRKSCKLSQNVPRVRDAWNRTCAPSTRPPTVLAIRPWALRYIGKLEIVNFNKMRLARNRWISRGSPVWPATCGRLHGAS